MKRIITVLLLFAALPACADWTRLKADIHPGMTQEQVREVLPKHNYFYRDHSYALCAKPPWSWDQVGPMSYLICTYGNAQDKLGNIEKNDVVTYVEIVEFAQIAVPNGRGRFRVNGMQPVISKAVWECICLIHRSPEMNPIGFDPVALVRAVNGLRAHGKAAAIEALTHYRNMSMDWEGTNRSRLNLDQERIYNICHLLFKPRKVGLPMPQHPGPSERPLILVDDIPFYPIQFDFSIGPPLGPADLIQFCKENCSLRAQPLEPGTSPIPAVEKLCASESLRDRNPQFAREQALRCLRLPEYEETTFREPFDFKICPSYVGKEGADRFWKEYTATLMARPVKWDAEAQEFKMGEHPTTPPTVQ